MTKREKVIKEIRRSLNIFIKNSSTNDLIRLAKEARDKMLHLIFIGRVFYCFSLKDRIIIDRMLKKYDKIKKEAGKK